MNEPKINNIGIIDVSFGTGVSLIQPVNLYGCVVGNDCKIGPFVEIQHGVILGDRTKIQSHSFICEGVEIGEDCFVGHGVMFVNDLFKDGVPAGGDKTKWGKCAIGKNVSIGSNATILPVNIVDGCVIGAGSVVTKNILVKGIYAGNPAKLIRLLND
jgi:acetyltransferase-like isoleucine patch superfamily enzyme